MPKSQVRKIASMGGKAHAQKLHEEMNEEEDDDSKLKFYQKIKKK